MYILIPYYIIKSAKMSGNNDIHCQDEIQKGIYVCDNRLEKINYFHPENNPVQVINCC